MRGQVGWKEKFGQGTTWKEIYCIRVEPVRGECGLKWHGIKVMPRDTHRPRPPPPLPPRPPFGSSRVAGGKRAIDIRDKKCLLPFPFPIQPIIPRYNAHCFAIPTLVLRLWGLLRGGGGSSSSTRRVCLDGDFRGRFQGVAGSGRRRALQFSFELEEL